MLQTFDIISSVTQAVGAADVALAAAPAGTTHAYMGCNLGSTSSNGIAIAINAAAVAGSCLKLYPTGPIIIRLAAGDVIHCIQYGAASQLDVTYLKANAVTESGKYQPGLIKSP